MRIKHCVLPGLLIVALSLTACDKAKEALGMSKRSPDEFQVVRHAPLSMPPNFNNLPAPQPGAARPQEGTAQDQAAAAVFGGSYGTPDAGAADLGRSTGEAALLQGAGGSDPNIRDLVDQETAELAEDENSLLDRLAFWREDEPYGEILDPTEEQRRIQENQALGKPLTEGETPMIIRRKRALLEGLF